jgi:hypothetical protein
VVIKGHLNTLHVTRMPYAASLGAETGVRESGLSWCAADGEI